MDMFFEDSALAQLVIDPIENRIIKVNIEGSKLLRDSIENIQHKSPIDYFKSDLEAFISFTIELIENKRAWRDLLVVINDSSDLIEVTGKAVEYNGSSVLFLSLESVNERERKKRSASVKKYFDAGLGHWKHKASVFDEFERRNKLLLDAVGDGIYGVDIKGNTTFVNPAAEIMLGYKAEELLGRNMHSAVHYAHEDGHHFSAQECPIFKAFREDVVHKVDDDIFWTKLGTTIVVEYTSTPIRDFGVVIGAVVVFRDVTKRNANQRKLLTALEEVQSLKDKLTHEKDYLEEEIKSDYNYHHIIGKSNVINRITEQISLVAPTDSTVLVTGESGTGKELIARAIHDLSPRSKHALIKVNCSAIPEELFESEFFGHVKGAFTGAVADRVGRFELANEGTLFLDEVGELSLNLQSKLLRVVQEQQFERVGDTKTISVNVRIISATNRDLKQQVQKGLFREDLYFRLNVFPIESVPLRDRGDDISLLAKHFIQKFSVKTNKPNLRVPLIELEKLKHYSWPGNIRELENVIERQVILSQGNIVNFDNLIPSVFPKQNQVNSADIEKVLSVQDLAKLDKQNCINALIKTQGRVSGVFGAAKVIGIKSSTLFSKLTKYKIDVNAFKVKS
ncbi:sigma 54-interacting transcriptional regulator [Paraglaciecola sp. 20A4]|uniref:sigma 54-interacting transcriptional regulator n=1 Tax=Paraglaciecola sp. 20A4 TaxID=2687288 RepID=UPI0014082216|nr:sigma 54-interacting transcriptional regulator [Paraglaciecola sp. 20A4]